ncbi:MAG: hypothetical protein QHH27_02945 [Clostridia bacterium]|jgi:hypothetical protein|nr:hypothetical protein [Clostridia bacterium]MDH7572493.1 hypothetical protein [Clostridia bacterium]
MVRRKRWWCSFLLSGVLLLLLPTVAGARLLVSSPEETLQSADLIITGTVMAREYGEAERRVTVEVDEVLKGDFRADELSLARQKNPVCGWAGFDFPAPGTQVFLLLCGEAEQGYRPARDLNYVAVVEGDRVTGLYRGYNVGINGRRWSREAYAAAYDAFYQAHRSKEVAQASGDRSGLAAGAGTGQEGQQPAEVSWLSRVWRCLQGLWDRLL